MAPRLRIPSALAFTVVGAAVAVSSPSCGEDTPTPDARACVYCVYESVDNGNCPFPTCATGPEQNVCPEGCYPAPVG